MTCIVLEKGQKLEDVIQGYDKVLIQFSAEWCRPCKFITPIVKNRMEELVSEDNTLSSKILYVYVNIEEHPILSAKYYITYIPCFHIKTPGENISCNPIVSGDIDTVVEFCINNGIPLKISE